jgi:hypothetical protein
LRYPPLTAEQYFTQFFKLAKKHNAHTMILSGEHFFGGRPRIWDVKDTETHFKIYRSKINTLSTFLTGHQVTLLAYLRPQVDWLASSISQTVRILGLIPQKSFYQNDEQFFELSKPLLLYYQRIKAWAEILCPSRMLIIPYDRSQLYEQNAVADFLKKCDLLDVCSPMGTKAIQLNTSLSREYVEVKKRLNQRPKSKTTERIIISCLEHLSGKQDNFTPYRLNPDLARKVREFVQPENDLLSWHFMDGVLMNAQSGKITDYEYEPISPQKIDEAMAEFNREYKCIKYRIMWFDQKLRALLRKYAMPVHGVLHQLRQLQRGWSYRWR